MKRQKKFLAMFLVGLLAIGALAGCGSSNSNSSTGNSATSSTSEKSENTSAAKEETSEDIIGQITSKGDTSITLEVYEPDKTIDDYTEMDGVTLTATGDSKTIDIDDDTNVRTVSSGVTTTSTTDALALGDMVAVTTNSSGDQELVILDANTYTIQNSMNEEDASGTSGTAGENTLASENAGATSENSTTNSSAASENTATAQ